MFGRFASSASLHRPASIRTFVELPSALCQLGSTYDGCCNLRPDLAGTD